MEVDQRSENLEDEQEIEKQNTEIGENSQQGREVMTEKKLLPLKTATFCEHTEQDEQKSIPEVEIE